MGHGYKIQCADSGLFSVTHEYDHTFLSRMLFDSEINLLLHGQKSAILVILIESGNRDFQWHWPHTRMEIKNLSRADPFRHIFIICQTR